MSEDNYTRQVLEGIESKRVKRLIEAELENHLAEASAALTDLGCPPEDAANRANAAMGENPEAVGAQLNAIHRGRTALRLLLAFAAGTLPVLSLALLDGIATSQDHILFAPGFLLEFSLLLYVSARKRTRVYLFPALFPAAGAVWLCTLIYTEAARLFTGELLYYVEAAFADTYVSSTAGMAVCGVVLAAVWCASFLLITALRCGQITKRGLVCLRVLRGIFLGAAAAALCLLAVTAVLRSQCSFLPISAEKSSIFRRWYLINAERELTDDEIRALVDELNAAPPEDVNTETKLRYADTWMTVLKIETGAGTLEKSREYVRIENNGCAANESRDHNARLRNERGDLVSGTEVTFRYAALYPFLCAAECDPENGIAAVTRYPVQTEEPIRLQAHGDGLRAQITIRIDRPQPPPKDFSLY